MSDAVSPTPRGRVAALILILLGAALLLLAVATAAPSVGFFARAKSTEGTFVGAIERPASSHGAAFYHPMFRYQSADGFVRTFTANGGSTGQHYDDGAKATVYYDPAKPEDAKLNSVLEIWMTPLLTGAVGAVVLAIGVMLRRGARRIA